MKLLWCAFCVFFLLHNINFVTTEEIQDSDDKNIPSSKKKEIKKLEIRVIESDSNISNEVDYNIPKNNNNNWKNIENTKLLEINKVTSICRNVINNNKLIINNIINGARDKLNNKNECKTAVDTRKIVINALKELSIKLNNIIDVIRENLIKISNIFVLYFQLTVAKCNVFNPESALALHDLYEEVILDKKLIDVTMEEQNKQYETLNNVLRYFSGTYNPARTLYKALKKLNVDNGDDFHANLIEAINQIDSIGEMLQDIVDIIEKTTYDGIEIYYDGIKVLKAIKIIFHKEKYEDKRNSIGEVKEFNDILKLSVKLSKNMKATKLLSRKKMLQRKKKANVKRKIKKR